MEDIGSNYWANWGIRPNFGPVLLDFPYVFKLDGNKLFCRAPSHSDPSGCCNGELDYDVGFNFIYCKKCGIKYKASELAEAINKKKINLVKPGKDIKMRITAMINGKNVEIECGDDNVFSSPSMAMPKEALEASKVKVLEDVDFTKFIANDTKVEERKEEKKEAPEVTKEVPEVSNKEEEEIKKVTEEAPVEKEVKEKKKDVKKSTSNSGNKKEKKNPFAATEVKSYEDQIKDAVNSLKALFDLSRAEGKEISYDILKPLLPEFSLIDFESDELYEIITKLFDNEKIKLDVSTAEGMIYGTLSGFDDSIIMTTVENLVIPESEEVTENVEEVAVANNETSEYTEEENYDEYYIDEPISEDVYNGITYYQATNINIKAIFPEEEQDCNVLVINDIHGYLKDSENNLIVIDDIDNQDTNHIKMVSEDVFKSLLEAVSASEENTGAFPPTIAKSVNGVEVIPE